MPEDDYADDDNLGGDMGEEDNLDDENAKNGVDVDDEKYNASINSDGRDEDQAEEDQDSIEEDSQNIIA